MSHVAFVTLSQTRNRVILIQFPMPGSHVRMCMCRTWAQVPTSHVICLPLPHADHPHTLDLLQSRCCLHRLPAHDDTLSQCMLLSTHKPSNVWSATRTAVYRPCEDIYSRIDQDWQAQEEVGGATGRLHLLSMHNTLCYL